MCSLVRPPLQVAQQLHWLKKLQALYSLYRVRGAWFDIQIRPTNLWQQVNCN